MRTASRAGVLVASAVLVLASGSPLRAQLRVGAAAGGTVSSVLVRDSITVPVTVTPKPGAQIAFWLETRLNSTYRVSASLSTAWSTLSRTEERASTGVVPLATWTPAVTLDRVVLPGLSVGASAGAVIYRADRARSNLFRLGANPAPVFGANLRFDHPTAGGLVLTGRLGYDVHAFTTPALRDAGFRGSRPVHRVAITFGVSRGL
jgi:hypothetical protein